MEFGRIEQDGLNTLNTLLPKYSEATVSFLHIQESNSKGTLRIGLSKWGRKDWAGVLYPKDTKDKYHLKEYGNHFNCIELNSTFYQIYPTSIIEAWANDTPDDFLFCPKFNQGITHFRRLKNCESLLVPFLNQIRAFGKKLGPCFLQLPDNFGPNKYDDLQSFLLSLPKELQFFLEVRHADWFIGEERERLYDFLAANNIGWVITDTSGRRDVVHMELTIPKTYIRFVGNDHETDYSRVDSWIERISRWIEAGVDVFFMVHMVNEINTPILAEYVAKQFNLKCGLNIPVPQLLKS